MSTERWQSIKATNANAFLLKCGEKNNNRDYLPLGKVSEGGSTLKFEE